MENIPFKAGQLAELRSFGLGYRGAWFRCKIKEITEKNGIIGHISEYYDYADEKLTWSKLYQLPMGNTKRKHSELMLRPQYPPICNEKQLPHASEISEVTVIVCDSWKVGDLVDLFHTGCYWCGRITQLFDDQKAQIELRPPPLGEGSSYKALLKDLRPSLDWSLQHGWTLPTQDDGFGHPCARLVKPINQGASFSCKTNPSLHNGADPVAAVSDATKSRTATETPACSLGKTVSKKRKHIHERSTRLRPADSAHNGADPAAEIAQGELNLENCQEKNSASGRIDLLSKGSDHIEAAILDLEEYVNKVKWLKKLMQCGISSSDARVPRWEFVEEIP